MWFVILGIAAGVLSGFLGIGGGIIIIPTLVYIFGFSQLKAQGTSLAILLAPVGIFAVWTYYTKGNIDVKAALLICLGFIVGGYFGAKIASHLPVLYLKRSFGILMILMGAKFLFSKK